MQTARARSYPGLTHRNSRTFALGSVVSADVERGAKNGIRRGDTEGDSLTFSRQPDIFAPAPTDHLRPHCP
jgi:hypothetical protein